MSATARRYGLSPAHLFLWRRLAREGRLGGGEPSVGFAEAVIACEQRRPAAASPTSSLGGVEIVLRDGLRVVAEASMDADALARLVRAIERR